MSPNFRGTPNFIVLAFCVAFSNVVLGNTSQEVKDITAVTENNRKQSAPFSETDTDMLMEPNDYTPISILRSLEQPPYNLHENSPHFQPFQVPQIAARIDAPTPSIVDAHAQAAKRFYPPYFQQVPPLAHSHPFIPLPEPAPEHKYAAIKQQARTGAPAAQHANNFDVALLGSGDFGVLRGGTFYPEEEIPYHAESNNAPSTEEFAEAYTYPEEQFANFRDFADINTPNDAAFSHFVVVYAAKNSTAENTHARPKNIFEQLQLVDREKALEEKKQGATSRSKSKLTKTKLQKKYRKKANLKEFDYEPLLATS